MAELKHIVHSIPPTFDARSRVLVLGSIPSPASRELGFNYGHPRNRFWCVMAQLAGEPLPATNERKRDFCLRHHIALWDVVAECDIVGASDASIANARPNRLADILDAAPIEAVFCTGAKAYDLYRRLCQADTGIPAVKLPSTSPANAACGMGKLLREYAAIFEHEHPFCPPVLDVPAVVALEQAIASAGTPLSELMDRAGTALAARVMAAIDRMPEAGAAGSPAGSGAATSTGDSGTGFTKAPVEAPGEGPVATIPAVVVLCGNGNNGGDGWVAAAQLAQARIPVCLIAAKSPEELRAQPARDAAIAAAAAMHALGGRVLRSGQSLPLEGGALPRTPLLMLGCDEPECGQAIARAQVVVDAILGTGASAQLPREPFRSWIDAANKTSANHFTIAADVPSGISAQDGSTAGVRIRADETVTMIVPKPGLTAPECGAVHVAPLAYIEPHLD